MNMGNVLASLHFRTTKMVHKDEEAEIAGIALTDEGFPKRQLTYSECVAAKVPYFGKNCIIGGRRKETQPESFLFGDNANLDFLGSTPGQAPITGGISPSEAIVPLNLLVHIRRESLKMIKAKDTEGSSDKRKGIYRIEFIFDADVAGWIQIHFHVNEEAPFRLTFQDKWQSRSSERFPFEAGNTCIFNAFEIPLTQMDFADLQRADNEYVPILITIGTEDGSQMQTTAAIIEVSHAEMNPWNIRPLRQRIHLPGSIFLQEEIFGIENRDANGKPLDYKCVICLEDLKRSTVALPCRHLCVCDICGKRLIHEDPKCPICRHPFHAMIEIAVASADSEKILLVEALNGKDAVNREESSSLMNDLPRSRLLTAVEEETRKDSSLSANSTRSKSSTKETNHDITPDNLRRITETRSIGASLSPIPTVNSESLDSTYNTLMRTTMNLGNADHSFPFRDEENELSEDSDTISFE